MCILLVSTTHPDYSLILLNNRDEYLSRPTARAAWWASPNGHVLGGRDLQRPVQGTWLGMTRQGKIAVLTNFREEGAELIEGSRSRGEIPLSFLTVPPQNHESPEDFAHRLIEVEGVHGVGGFSLAFGHLQSEVAGDGAGGFAFVSNRTPDVEGLKRAGHGTWGLSNSHYGDRAWPKVVDGERLLGEVVREDVEAKRSPNTLELIENCFVVLSTDTLPAKPPGEDFQLYVRQLRHSIFIPAVGGEGSQGGKSADELAAATEQTPISTASGGVYGTQKQTVILVDRRGKVTFVERTLYDHGAQPVAEHERDRKFEFDIEGWEA